MGHAFRIVATALGVRNHKGSRSGHLGVARLGDVGTGAPVRNHDERHALVFEFKELCAVGDRIAKERLLVVVDIGVDRPAVMLEAELSHEVRLSLGLVQMKGDMHSNTTGRVGRPGGREEEWENSPESHGQER